MPSQIHYTDAKGRERIKVCYLVVGKYTYKNSVKNVDIDVEAIDTKELLDSDERLEKITDYYDHHNNKTHNKAFTGMFCVSSVDTARYYDLFKEKDDGLHDLKIATIFSHSERGRQKAQGIFTLMRSLVLR